MIIVNLKGGLGNQMFQYAFGKRLATQNSDTLKLDLTSLLNAEKIGNIHRPYSLGRFALSAPVANPEEIERIKPKTTLWSRVIRKVQNRLTGNPTVRFNATLLEVSGDHYVDGFYQSPRYFETIRETLLKDFTLATPLSGVAAQFAAQINSSDSVSIHVRRGDYAKNPRVLKEFGLCSIAYYTKAIEKICGTVSSPTFFVFSDDIAWVKENLPVGENAVFVHGEGLTDTAELTLMSKCKHNIIANSSFSWWGAWLNQNPGKMVIAPTPWFDNSIYDKDLIPPAWIQLPK